MVLGARIAIGLMLAMVAGAARADNSVPPVAAPPAPAGAAPRVWVWMERSLPVTQPGTIRQAPSDDAAAVGEAVAGQSVFVVGLLQDREWLQIAMPDTQATGYVHAATVAADEPPPPGRPVPLPISGRPTVRDTATLVVEDHVVGLAGLTGYGGALADALQHYLDGNGGFVLCSQVADASYACATRDGVDVAKVALVNGVARMAADAPPADAAQQASAQQNQRGIWAPQADPEPPPPPPPRPVLPDWETEFYLLHPVVPLGPADPDDPGAAAGGGLGDPGYGAVLIDGELVTVVGGARVVLWHDPGLGWGFHDRDGHWRPPPPRLDRALDRHFGARPPDFAGHEGRPHELGRPMGAVGLRDVAMHAPRADFRGEPRAEPRTDFRGEPRADLPGRDPRADLPGRDPRALEPGHEARLAGPRTGPAPAPTPRIGAIGHPARGVAAPMAPGFMPRAAPGYTSRPMPGGGTPGYVSRFSGSAPRPMPGQSFYAPGNPGAPRFYPGVSPTPNAAQRMGAVAGPPRFGTAPPRLGAPMGMRPPMGMAPRPAMPTVNRAVVPHAVCHKPPC